MAFVNSLLTIFQQCLLPVFALVGLGWLVKRRVGLEVRTLVRLNFYVFVPAVVFDKLAKAQLPASDLWRVFGFACGLMAIMWLLTSLWCRARRYRVSLASAFTCATLFYNSGNYGLPVIELTFGATSPAMALQTIILAVQNMTTFSLGQVIIRGPQLGVRGALIEYLKMPFIYAIVGGLVLQATGWRLPGPVDSAVVIVAGGMVPVALITLGAQLGQVTWTKRLRPVASAAAMRLVVAPAVAFIALKALGWQGLVAQHLLISCSFPSAINAALMAVEYDNEPDFAAQTVMVTTLFSALTVAIVIYIARVAFPLA